MSDPQILLDEIDQEMALMMMDSKYFKIQALEPVHPLHLPKLENAWHYKELGYELKEIIQEEKCTEYNLNLVLY